VFLTLTGHHAEADTDHDGDATLAVSA
jgi:hypothetical protein